MVILATAISNREYWVPLTELRARNPYAQSWSPTSLSATPRSSVHPEPEATKWVDGTWDRRPPFLGSSGIIQVGDPRGHHGLLSPPPRLHRTTRVRLAFPPDPPPTSRTPRRHVTGMSNQNNDLRTRCLINTFPGALHTMEEPKNHQHIRCASERIKAECGRLSVAPLPRSRATHPLKPEPARHPRLVIFSSPRFFIVQPFTPSGSVFWTPDVYQPLVLSGL